MSAATPTAAVLNGPALRTMNASIRRQIIEVLNNPVFTGAQRKATGQRIKETDDPEQLFRWLRNVRKERDRRQNKPTTTT